MKRLGMWSLLAVLGGSSWAQAVDLKLTVSRVDDGSSNIIVGPGCVVNYQVVGELSDEPNRGLGLVGFDLEFSGGALAQADEPSSAPMDNFVIPNGLTNPAGYGGTVVGDKLIQCGGAQNTINNTLAFAPYPLGTVIPDIAKHGSAQQLLTGSLTAPMIEGSHTVAVTNQFANVIRDGETGVVFWAVDPAGTSVPTNLVINVQAGASCSSCASTILASDPPSGAIDARQPHTVGNTDPQGILLVDVDMPSCAVAGGVGGSDFTITEVGGTSGVPSINSVDGVDGDTIRLNLSGPIEPKAWTVITHNASGSKICLGFLPGDVDGNGQSNSLDVSALIDSLNLVPGRVRPIHSADVDRSGVAAAQDIARVIDLLNGAGLFDVYLAAQLPASPCP